MGKHSVLSRARDYNRTSTPTNHDSRITTQIEATPRRALGLTTSPNQHPNFATTPCVGGRTSLALISARFSAVPEEERSAERLGTSGRVPWVTARWIRWCEKVSRLSRGCLVGRTDRDAAAPSRKPKPKQENGGEAGKERTEQNREWRGEKLGRQLRGMKTTFLLLHVRLIWAWGVLPPSPFRRATWRVLSAIKMKGRCQRLRQQEEE
ncbi:hypothetical protein NL676_006346 [Syzygium grande]|nr:hypothetical protein NL676_006346 [Syzygium grande]